MERTGCCSCIAQPISPGDPSMSITVLDTHEVSTTELTFITMAIVATIGDAATTWIGLSTGLPEGNPVVAGAINVFGFSLGLVVIKGAAVSLVAVLWTTVADSDDAHVGPVTVSGATMRLLGIGAYAVITMIAVGLNMVSLVIWFGWLSL